MKNIYKILGIVANILLVTTILGIVLMFIGHPWAKIFPPETLWLLVVIWIIMAVMNKMKEREKQ